MKMLPQKRHTTSASNIKQRKLCPGSARMEAPIAEVESEFSAEGTMLHELFFSGITRSDLKPEQAEALATAERDANAFFATFRNVCGIPEDAKFIETREVPMWLRRPKTSSDFLNEGAPMAGEPEVFPGHADVIRVWPEYDAAAVVDAKFGFMEVEDAADNLQLASYAAMQAQAWDGLEKIGVCIVQPRNFGPRHSSAIYTRQAIGAAGVEIIAIYDEAQKPDAPIVAGATQCHFCKAKAICPAYAAIVTAPNIGDIAVKTLENDRLEKLLNAIQFANAIQKEVYGEVKERIRLGGFPGYKLQNTGDVTTLNNTVGLFEALAAYFHDKPEFTATKFDDCRQMGWTKLTEVVQQLTGISEKKAKQLIEDLAAPFVTKVPKEKRIVKEKAGALK